MAKNDDKDKSPKNGKIKNADKKAAKTARGKKEVVTKEIIIERASIKDWAQAVGIIGILVLLVFLLLTFKSSISPKKQVAFDLKGTYKAFFKQAYKQHLTRTQIHFLGKRFPRALSYAVSSYSKEHHAIVFNKSAVIYGMKDVTPAIQQGVAKEMAHLAKKGRR